MGDYYTADKRKYTRLPVSKEASLWAANQMLACEILDISIKGALIRYQGNWDPHTLEEVELLLCLDDSKQECIQMEGEVRHVFGQKVGIYCGHLPLENINTLRKLMQQHSENPELIERELEVMLNNS